MQSFETVSEPAQGFYEEKRSRFIASLVHVTDEAAANAYIASVKKEHHDARHVVSAYRLLENGLSRFSDDGEPHGTAGKPIFDCLTGAELFDVCLCVTRYFGGVLLGTGGLCRAYTAAAQDCLAHAERVSYRPFLLFHTSCDYAAFRRLNDLVARFGGKMNRTDYAESVCCEPVVPFENDAGFRLAVREAFGGTLTLADETVTWLPSFEK